MTDALENKAFTEKFFAFAKENGFSSQDIADEMGKTRVVISNWRSKSCPLHHRYACQAFMDRVEMKKILLRGEG